MELPHPRSVHVNELTETCKVISYGEYGLSQDNTDVRFA